MNSEPTRILDVSNRRRSPWRKQVRDAVSETSPVVANGLFVHFNKRSQTIAASEALEKLSRSEREHIWRAAFPGIADVVEVAWTKLPSQTVARRDSGISGHGEPFTWKLSAAETAHFKIEWLRKLLIAVGPFPEMDFADIIQNIGLIAGGRSEETDGDYLTETTGHFYDTDAPAYAASALLSHQPDSAMAKEIVEIFDAQLLNQLPNGCTRATMTAWICADRPDLWRKLDDYLAASADSPAFTDLLLGSRVGGQPGAWLHLLQTIRDHQLLRLNPVNEWARNQFGMGWRWKSHKRDDVQPWFERWLEMHESATARESAYNAMDPGDFALALWGEAVTDGEAALARISDPSQLSPDLRIAAAHFLEVCPAKRRASHLLKYAMDADLRVANQISHLLTGWGNIAPTADDAPDVFARLCRCLDAIPAKPVLAPNPNPFPDRKLNLDGIADAVANLFPDGAETIVERLLPKMGASARDRVVSRLNRYRLTEDDRSMAKVIHGKDPEEWQRWLIDNEGNQFYAQRLLLLKMISDRNMEIAEHAYKAVKTFTISREEIAILRPLLATKSAKKHLFVTQLLSNQPEESLTWLTPDLLGGKLSGERLAGLEILRSLAEDPKRNEIAHRLWKCIHFQPKSPDEQRALGILTEALGNDETIETPGVENAFGLVDPAMMIAPHEPQDHDIMLHSPVTEKLIQWLDEWLVSHADVMIPSTQSWVTKEPQRLGDTSVPTVSHSQSMDENLRRFPPAKELAEWWDNRPADQRNPDGFEMIRLQLTLKHIEGKKYVVLKTLFGLESGIITQSNKYHLQCLTDWILLQRPDAWKRGDWRNYLIDATETVFVRLSEKQKNWAHFWHSLVQDHLVRSEDCPDEIIQRLWSLGRCRSSNTGSPFAYDILDIARFHQRGIAKDHEIIWRLVGARNLNQKYNRESAFRELTTVTQPPGRYNSAMNTPAFRAVIQRVCNRIVELELSRGEAPETWSMAANAIQSIYGAHHLIRLLTALGSIPLTRKRSNSGDTPDQTRPAVLIHLINVCHPAESDTAEDFNRLVREAGIPTNRLLEIAIFRPVWTEFIEHATGITGLRDAVGWVFAHTRSSDYVWESQARELWAGELNFQTSIPPAEFIEGAVDPEWFYHAHKAVGSAVWDKLYVAAKFASTGRGHTRARLFSDALLDKVTIEDLQISLEKNGNLDAALALGLPTLPKAKKARRSELLRRYEILQALKNRSKKSKAQRAASEHTAFEMAVRNLARRAGFTDTVRFEWAMETEAVADFGTLITQIGDLSLAIEITPAGDLELNASRDGKPIATIPAAVKNHADFKALQDRMAGLKQQTVRLRPALEDLMTRKVSLTSGEWQRLIHHPLAGPLLARLVLASEVEILGFPHASGLGGLQGQIIPWPADSTEIHLAHPVDFLPADRWHAWQREVFDRKIVQPFKQVFRELYLPTPLEMESNNSVINRFQKPRLLHYQLFAILRKRGWVFHSEYGVNRFFRNEGITAWISFDEYSNHPSTARDATLNHVHFTRGKSFQSLPVSAIPPRIFSEVLRDVDLIVSVAHAYGSNPETTFSTLESRAALVRETCHLLGLSNVAIEEKHAIVSGKLGNYRIHLDSGIVHRIPGAMIPVISDAQTERGRIFLPFADDDSRAIDVLSRIILFANDEAIRDPEIAKAISHHQQTKS